MRYMNKREKLSKQMSKIIKSGKLDNVFASMDTGEHYIAKLKDGTVTLIEKEGLQENVGKCLGIGCFIIGTLVTTSEGLKPIEEIQIGDYVLSRNEDTGEISYKKVTATLVRSTREICTIELENEKILSTTGHLFMVKNEWWKSACELKCGDILETSDKTEQVIKRVYIQKKEYPIITYNLTVEDYHTFFVGNKNVLTHNTIDLLKKCDFTKDGIEEITEKVTDTLSTNDILKNVGI